LDSNGRVLVVDDEEVLARVMARRLRVRGLEAEVCTSGQEALELLLSPNAPWDLVLLDIVMPELSGLSVLSRIRAVREPADLPVIMLTSRSDPDAIVMALEQGANDYVTKPAEMSVLMARIGAQLDRRNSDRALRASEERYAIAAQGARDVLWDWSVEKDELYLSPRWNDLIQSREEASQATGIVRLVGALHEADRGRVQEAIRAHLGGMTKHLEVEARLNRGDGTTVWALLRGAAVRGGDRSVRMAGSLTDLSSPHLHDPVTGLPNRVAFLGRLEAAVQASRGTGLAVFVLSLQRAITVEQTLGSEAGKELLDLAAARMGSVLDDATFDDPNGLLNMSLARLDGADFAILLEQCPDPETALRTGRRLLQRAQRPYLIGQHEVRCGASLGLALSEAGPDNGEALLSRALSALGRSSDEADRVAIYDPAVQRRAVQRLELETDLALAIDSDELRLEYQPVVDLRTREIVAVEALARWDHPERGGISPGEFVPLAEATGLATPLGEWVLRTACSRVASWTRPDGRPIRIAVNVSPVQFEGHGLLGLVEDVLATTGLKPDRLELELTEGVFARDAEHIASVLGQLRALGVRVALDDFGTGYSSLAYLARFPIDTLKLDRSFVGRLPEEQRAEVITRATLAMAQELGLHVVAEGIERLETADFLNSLDCTFAQGFYFHRPMRPEQLEEQLALQREAAEQAS
jgi:EAL domain-containing protein (putative c-di-GMP-specific phosphodiesterase class I)/PleD family two-component response regulator